ncbi:hypothetical protein Tco_0173892 [Tanacetum coccineum]
MDVKSAFLYGTIEEEVYVHHHPGFVDHCSSKTRSIRWFPKLFMVLHKILAAWYETLSSIPGWRMVKQQPDGIFISQDKYELEFLKNPLVHPHIVHLFNESGSRMYLTASRPNIMFVVCAYARDSLFELEAFSDSNYAGASLDRKSTTGGCQFLGRRLISWQCKKQTIVANSTTEAEYVAAAYCCGKVLWIQNQMMDYGFNFMNTKIHIDNESTICVIKNPVYHSRTKHIEIRHHFIRDCYEKRLIDAFGTVKSVVTFEGRISWILRMDRLAVLANKINYGLYALTHNPTIYDSLVKQFWQTATVKTLANETQQLVASIDSKEYSITEASVRSKLQLADATGIHNLFDAEIYYGLATLGYVTEGESLAQPAEPHHTPVDPIPSTSHSPDSPPYQLPPYSPPYHSPTQSSPHFSPPRSYEAPLPEGNTSGSAEDSVQLKELMKVETLETALKRKSKKVLISESEGEESKDQGRKIQDIDDDPLVSLVRGSMKEKSPDFVTPTKALGEAQEEEISPTILEAAKTLSKVSTGSTKIDSGTASERGQREGKAPMTEENIQATHKTKEQLRQEEAGLEEAIKLQAQLDEEVAKQIHLDKMIAKRMAKKEALSEKQKKRKSQV